MGISISGEDDRDVASTSVTVKERTDPGTTGSTDIQFPLPQQPRALMCQEAGSTAAHGTGRVVVKKPS